MKLVTVSELAEAMGWSQAKARKLVEKRVVPVFKDPFDNRLRVDLDRMLELRHQAADQAHKAWQARRIAPKCPDDGVAMVEPRKRGRGRPRKSDPT